jgi:hypothetical protein
VTLLFFGAAGLVAEKAVPGADSVGDVWRALASPAASSKPAR